MEGNMHIRLTDKVVKDAVLPAKGTTRIWDAPDPKRPEDFARGFGIRLAAGGGRSFMLRYRPKGPGADERLFTIGVWPEWSVRAARDEAIQLRRRIKDGADPQKQKDDDRDAPTMAKLCDRFIEEHLPLKRPGTAREYSSLIRLYVLPGLGRKLVAAVDHDDVCRLHAKVTERSKYQANRMAGVLSKMFTLAIRWKMRPDNPASRIEHNPEVKRKRYLKPDELARLTDALAQDENQHLCDVLRLLLLTGARKSEVLHARWDEFDLIDREVWVKPDHATKQRKEHEAPLSRQALAVLKAMRGKAAPDAQFLFPGVPEIRVRIVWDRVCKRAGIPRTGPNAVRVHDLRHSYASFMVSAGFSLPVVGAMLGHTQAATTQRYAHLMDNPLREAANKMGSLMGGLVTAKPSKRKRKPRLRVVR
jgi:integrase